VRAAYAARPGEPVPLFVVSERVTVFVTVFVDPQPERRTTESTQSKGRPLGPLDIRNRCDKLGLQRISLE
jgi:hypothetical protein